MHRNKPLLWLMLSMVLLLIAYIPIGFLAPLAGISIGWQSLTTASNVFLRIWGAWLIVATVTGNVQVLLSLLSAADDNQIFQNSKLKTVATLGQLSWVYPGYMFYPWYFWVVGTAILFTITPNPALFRTNASAPRRPWSESKLLEKLQSLSTRKSHHH